jgi:hypothetical protein
LLARVPIGELMELGEEVLDNVLLARFRHVAFEAQRVDRACQALRRGSALAFGELMNASHTSLASDFEVSHPALDELATVARSAGARGARLTGAGFGGSIVALTESDHAESLVAARCATAFTTLRPPLPGLDSPILIAHASAGRTRGGVARRTRTSIMFSGFQSQDDIPAVGKHMASPRTLEGLLIETPSSRRTHQPARAARIGREHRSLPPAPRRASRLLSRSSPTTTVRANDMTGQPLLRPLERDQRARNNSGRIPRPSAGFSALSAS